jgi:serine/threonine-protein kinase
MPDRIGPYRVLERLGAGGMGEVYLADDPRLARHVALKRVSAAVTDSAVARERLHREARAAARLSHPNIAGVHDIVEHEGESHIVMEYVPGETLAARLRRGPLTPEQALAIGAQLADALADAHAHHVIHRDLKPSNVQITPEGRVKVLDFGVSAMMIDAGAGWRADLPLTAARTLVGTPGYIAPELRLGHEADARSDIYSLGVVLGEMVGLGRIQPAPGLSRDDLETEIAKQLREREQTSAAADALARIIASAAAFAPQQRYQSAAPLARDIRAALDELSRDDTRSVISPVPLPGPPARGRLRHLVLPVGIGIVALLVTLLVQFVRRDGPQSPAAAVPTVAVLPFSAASADREASDVALGLGAVLTASLARLDGLNVIGHSAVAATVSGRRDPAGAGRELGATHLVDGDVQRSEERLQVVITLLEARTNQVIWSGDFAGVRQELFDLQRRAAAGLTEAFGTSRLVSREEAAALRDRLAVSAAMGPEALAAYAQGRRYLERPDVPGNVQRAIEAFETAVAREPQFGLAWAALGEARWARYAETKEPSYTDAARDALIEALRLDPEQPAVHHALAVLYRGTGRAADAMAQLRQSIERHPAHDVAHRLLGELLIGAGRTEEGLAELGEAIRLRPDYWQNHASLGLGYYDAGRYGDAAGAFTRLVQLQPDSAWGFQMLGTVYHAQDRLDDALRCYETANGISPTATAFNNIGTIHYWNGRYDRALAAYLESDRLRPNWPSTQMNLADTYRRLGDEAAAVRSLNAAVSGTDRALAVNQSDAASLALRALCRVKLGDRTGGIADAHRATERPVADSQVYYRAAAAFARAGERHRAVEALDLALSHGYSASVARRDESFDSLRGLAEFDRVLSRPRGRK